MLLNGDINGNFNIGLLCGINELIDVIYLEYWLAHAKQSICAVIFNDNFSSL